MWNRANALDVRMATAVEHVGGETTGFELDSNPLRAATKVNFGESSRAPNCK